MMFDDRIDAGKRLAKALEGYKKVTPVIVLALPRGGVVPAAEVASSLKAPLGLVIARKIGHPYASEFAIGAVTETGQPVWNERERDQLSAGLEAELVQKARAESKRRRIDYMGKRLPLSLAANTIIIVDDGMATGLTMLAAVKEVKSNHPKNIVVAIPVASRDAVDLIKNEADEVVVLDVPEDLGAVGSYYRRFDQVEDDEVRELIRNEERS